VISSFLDKDLSLVFRSSNDTLVNSDKAGYDLTQINPESLNFEVKVMIPGWYMLEVDLLHDQPSAVFKLEILKDKIKLRDYTLQIKNGRISKRLVYLPFGVDGLKINPLSTEGCFSVNHCKMVWLTPWFAYGRLLSRLINMHHQFRDMNFFDAIRFISKSTLPGGLVEKAFVFYEQTFINRQPKVSYSNWLKENDFSFKFDANDDSPIFSILLPTYKPDLKYLKECIESVISQNYSKWELCIVDDHSNDILLTELLENYSELDDRIKFIQHTSNQHICYATNTAFTLATGSYIALLDHDDTLDPSALSYMAEAIVANNNPDIIYSDEDKIDETSFRFDPHFKPDFNLDLLLSHNYICHLFVCKSHLYHSIGGMRPGFEGSQDHDFILRSISYNPEINIIHIPKVLYHWRAIEGSTALNASEKDYTSESGLKSVQEFMDVYNPGASVEYGNIPNSYKVNWPLPKVLPKVSLLIPTRDGYDILSKCIDTILSITEYENFEILILNNSSSCQKTIEYFSRVTAVDDRVRVIDWDNEFNYSSINNFGVGQASGSVLAFVNNDIEPINSNWLSEMVSHTCRPDVGCVGAKLYYPNETIQHAGVILGIGGVAGHSQKYFSRNEHGYFSRLRLNQELSAVTAACLLIRKDVFIEAGMFNEVDLAVAFNDVDLCLKVRELGYKNIWTPFAELYHHESISRGFDNTPKKRARAKSEADYMRNKWSSCLDNDPFYNPNLTLVYEDFSLR
jgi:glycosyltransferase involved in cell wall biosynthesis